MGSETRADQPRTGEEGELLLAKETRQQFQFDVLNVIGTAHLSPFLFFPVSALT